MFLFARAAHIMLSEHGTLQDGQALAQIAQTLSFPGVESGNSAERALHAFLQVIFGIYLNSTEKHPVEGLGT